MRPIIHSLHRSGTVATHLLNRYLGGGGGGGGGAGPEGPGMSRDERGEGERLTAVKKEIEMIIMKAVIMRAERGGKLLMSKLLLTARGRGMDRTCN